MGRYPWARFERRDPGLTWALLSPTDAVFYACPVQFLPAGIQSSPPAGPLHEEAGSRGKPTRVIRGLSFRGGSWFRSWGGVYCLPVIPSPQLDQLVIDSAVEKREMERKHAAIQQRVRHCNPVSLNRQGCQSRALLPHHHSTALTWVSSRYIHQLHPSSQDCPFITQ